MEARQYVLKPVDGDAKYSRHADELVTRRKDPHQDLHMVWPEFALWFSHLQAVNVTLLLQELSRHQVQHTASQSACNAIAATSRCPEYSRMPTRACMIQQL